MEWKFFQPWFATAEIRLLNISFRYQSLTCAAAIHIPVVLVEFMFQIHSQILKSD
jgi:hypothetical protein